MNNGMINKISNNLTLINEIVGQFRRQNLHAALRKLHLLSNSLIEIVQQLLNDESLQKYEINVEYFAGILSGVMDAQEKEDYVLVADLLELQIIPWLQQVQEVLISDISLEIDNQLLLNNIEGLRKRDAALELQLERQDVPLEYVVEPTSSGWLTLQVTDKTGTYYFHSNNNPVIEGNIFAEQYYSLDCSHYVVFGLGMGYHIKALLNMDDGLYIDIIEPDLNIIKVAFMMTNMEWIYSNPRVRLIYDKDYTKITSFLDRDNHLLIHYPSLRHISNPAIKLQLEKFFISDSGIRNMSIQFQNNFRENIQNCKRYVDELKLQFEGKNAIIVAAGPSLDKNIELLRNKPERTVIVAVGTVFHKLLDMNILPDYVIFLDAQPHLYQQVKEIENSEVPIICASTACKTIAQKYKGEKFLICQEGYDKAEDYANENGYQLYKTGGSVSTIALDMCIRLGCKEIAFVGLDLAYTDNKSHATNTAAYKLTDQNDKFSVPSINGGSVYVSRVFIMYREWIERRVEQEAGKVVVIDATEGGALKKGLVVHTLQETFNLWNRKVSD